MCPKDLEKSTAMNKLISCPACDSINVKPFREFRFPELPTGFFLSKCNSCGLLFILDIPSLSEISPIYGDNYIPFNTNLDKTKLKAEIYFRLFFDSDRPGRLLEIGCAYGHLLAVARREGWKVDGIELSSHAANKAREYYGLSVYKGAFENISIDGSFDKIIAIDVIEHSRDPKEFLGKCASLLHNDGKLILKMPNTKSIFHTLRGRRWGEYGAEHLYYFTPESVKHILSRQGFRIDTMFSVNNRLISNDGLWRLGLAPISRYFRRLLKFMPRKASEWYLDPLQTYDHSSIVGKICRGDNLVVFASLLH